MIRFLFLGIISSASIGFLGAGLARSAPDPAVLADHLSKTQVLYYGSWRCPACQAQGRLFGDAVSNLPYVECAKPKELPIQAAACKNAQIRAYPTWILPTGERRVGVQSLEELQVWTGMSTTP